MTEQETPEVNTPEVPEPTQQEEFSVEQKLELLAVNMLQLMAGLRELNSRLTAVEDYLGDDAEEEALEQEGPSSASH